MTQKLVHWAESKAFEIRKGEIGLHWGVCFCVCACACACVCVCVCVKSVPLLIFKHHPMNTDSFTEICASCETSSCQSLRVYYSSLSFHPSVSTSSSVSFSSLILSLSLFLPHSFSLILSPLFSLSLSLSLSLSTRGSGE